MLWSTNQANSFAHCIHRRYRMDNFKIYYCVNAGPLNKDSKFKLWWCKNLTTKKHEMESEGISVFKLTRIWLVWQSYLYLPVFCISTGIPRTYEVTCVWWPPEAMCAMVISTHQKAYIIHHIGPFLKSNFTTYAVLMSKRVITCKYRYFNFFKTLPHNSNRTKLIITKIEKKSLKLVTYYSGPQCASVSKP